MFLQILSEKTHVKIIDKFVSADIFEIPSGSIIYPYCLETRNSENVRTEYSQIMMPLIIKPNFLQENSIENMSGIALEQVNLL